MLYKDDWEQAQERMLAWWEGEVIDRACLQVMAPRDQQLGMEGPATLATNDLLEFWTDVDGAVARQASRIANTFWGGEAFPLFWANLGPDAFSAFLGAEPRFLDRQTSWVDPIITDWGTSPELTIREDNRWWQLQLDLLAAAKREGDGRWITGIPDTHAGFDALSALRGQPNLCLDLYDHPEEIKAAAHQTVAAGLQAYKVYYDTVESQSYGSSSGWLAAWGPGRCNVVQCDFIAFISPEMMEEFVLDGLAEEIRWLDRSVYHLDGPDAIRHLDLLLALPELNAIQWVPGAGALPMTRWIPLLKRIQAGGKSLHLWVSPSEVQTLLEELEAEGLLLSTTVTSEAEARDLLTRVIDWT